MAEQMYMKQPSCMLKHCKQAVIYDLNTKCNDDCCVCNMLALQHVIDKAGDQAGIQADDFDADQFIDSERGQQAMWQALKGD